MNAQKHIDSCIEQIKQMLGDANYEMTSEQRDTLVLGVRELKRLRKAERITQAQVFATVSLIAEAVYQIVNTEPNA